MGRASDGRAVAKFLDRARAGPAALFIDGEAGIGKTTLWLAAVERARDAGFVVLAAQGAPTESVLAYGGLADLVAEVDDAAWSGLAEPQAAALRGAVNELEVSGIGDARAVSAGFLSLVNALAARTPVLIAVDDISWLDRSTRDTLAFTAKRLAGPVGVLTTERRDPESASVSSWLRMMRPDSVQTLTMGPLSLGKLHAVLSTRLGRSFPRPPMVRIAEISGGNPCFALELGRAYLDAPHGSAVELPGTLAELVSARVHSLPTDAMDCLLAVACVGVGTVPTVAYAIGSGNEEAVALLERAEDDGVVTFVGHRVRFSHPLVAQGVYAIAAPSARRRMHRRLAEVLDEPELKARHLALASTVADPEMLPMLDDAARTARARGAPAAAAELLEIAIRLDAVDAPKLDADDAPKRRIRAARHYLAAGDAGAARTLLESTVEELPSGRLRARALAQLAAVHLFDDNFLEAAALLERALGEAGEDLAQRAQISITLALALSNGGHLDAAITVIEAAEELAEKLGGPPLLCQALTMRVHLHFLRGDGFDEASLQRALELESVSERVPVPYRPSLYHGLFLVWTGRLEEGREELTAIREQCIARGEESEMLPVTFTSFLVELWLGDIDNAVAVAADTAERAEQLGGDLAYGIAQTMLAAVAAHSGDENDARWAIDEALAASRRCGAATLRVWPLGILAFLEVSLQNYEAATAALDPALAELDMNPDATEIITAPFVADAAEAMVAVGQLERAESVIERLERNAARLQRPWLLAVSARCRGLLQTARGDLTAATRSVEEALQWHDKLPMPFERARSELLLGKLHRRRRHREAAETALRASEAAFDECGASLWVERARAELARMPSRSGGAVSLTPSERRVAELAAGGHTNRDIAAALFISPKTVEANLARTFRKLGIRSRSQLGRHVEPCD